VARTAVLVELVVLAAQAVLEAGRQRARHR